MRQFSRQTAIKLGQNDKGPRVYLQGKWLLRAGFNPGERIMAHFKPGRVEVELASCGCAQLPRKKRGCPCRKVSAKKAGTVGVIDINHPALARSLRSSELVVKASSGALLITPSKTERLRASRKQNGLKGSIFSGGGLLSQAAGLASFTPAFACELDPRYAEVFEANHPTATMFNMSVHELPWSELPQVELLTAGIPCNPFSKKRARKGLVPEAHELGDMIVWTLRTVEACNPYTVLVEQVPQFLTSGAGHIFLRALERMGYYVETRVLDPCDYGELAGRERAVIVGTTDPSVTWPLPEPRGQRALGELLEEVPETVWWDETSKPWIFAHWKKQLAKGNFFVSQVLDAATTRVSAITKRYFSGQGDGAVVAHPTRPDTYRWLTLGEVKALHGLPKDYYLGTAKCAAGEVMGQGVVVGTFAKVLTATTPARSCQ